MTAGSVPPAAEAAASGPRSVAARQISGPVVTGDNPQIDARAPVIAAGGIPRPADVAAVPGLNNLPRPPTAVFVGRDDALAWLHQALSGQPKTPGSKKAR